MCSDHYDGSTCPEGTQNAPESFHPCCGFFAVYMKNCYFKIRFEYDFSNRRWGILIPPQHKKGGYFYLDHCLFCGAKLDGDNPSPSASYVAKQAKLREYTPGKFIQELASGTGDPEQLLDEYISIWHQIGTNLDLPDWLGVTKKQYADHMDCSLFGGDAYYPFRKAAFQYKQEKGTYDLIDHLNDTPEFTQVDIPPRPSKEYPADPSCSHMLQLVKKSALKGSVVCIEYSAKCDTYVLSIGDDIAGARVDYCPVCGEKTAQQS